MTELRVGLENLVTRLDPVRGRFDVPSMVCAGAIYEPLAAYRRDGTVAPYLAAAIEPADGYRRWTIRLRPGIAFHDGTPVDTHAVVANLRARLAEPLGRLAWADVAAVDRGGDGESVVVSTKAPWASFPGQLTGQLGLMASASVLAGSETPCGSGAYVFCDRDDGVIRVRRFESHWRAGPARLSGIRFVVLVRPEDRAAALLDGRIDLFHTTDAATILAMGRTPGVSVVQGTDLAEDTGCVMLNLDGRATSSHDFRRALAHALDRRMLVEKVFSNVAPIANSPFAAFAGDAAFPAYDPAIAIESLEAFRRNTGLAPELRLTTTTTALNRHTVELVSEMWRAVGIATNVEQVPQDRLIERALVGDYDAMEWHQFGTVDPDENYMFWASSTAAPVGSPSANMARIRSLALDSALQAGRRSAVGSRRAAAYQKAARVFADELPFLWINKTPYRIIARAGLHSVGTMRLPDLSEGLGVVAGRFWVGEITERAPSATDFDPRHGRASVPAAVDAG